MRIALVSYEYPVETGYGGIATYVQQAAYLLANRGHSVEVFTASLTADYQKLDNQVYINLVKAPDASLFAQSIEPIFTQRHAERAFDVIESPDYFADGYAIHQRHPTIAYVVKLHTPHKLLGNLAVCPPRMDGWLRHNVHVARNIFGYWRRGLVLPKIKRYQPNRRIEFAVENVELEHAQQCDLVVSPSTALKAWAVREWTIDADASLVIPYAYVPTAAMLQIDTAPRSNGMNVGFFGKLNYGKGIDDLVAAIPLVLQREPRAQFHFFGKALMHPASLRLYDVEIRARLKRYLRSIHLHGAQPLATMPQHYAGVDICVFPSLWDNFPNVCLEAMSAGRAIVGSREGGMADMLEDGTHGLLISPKRPQEIADAIVRLLRDPALRARLGANARERLLDEYSASKVAPQMEAGYRIAIERARAKVRPA